MARSALRGPLSSRRLAPLAALVLVSGLYLSGLLAFLDHALLDLRYRLIERLLDAGARQRGTAAGDERPLFRPAAALP